MVQIQMFRQLVECCSNAYPHLVGESRNNVISYMDKLLHVVRERECKISGQIDEINMEIQRFHKLCQLHKMKSKPEYKMNCNNSEVKKCFDTANRIAYSIEKFSKECDRALRDALENLSKEIKSAVKITDWERKLVVGAVGYKQGHWYTDAERKLVVGAVGYKQGHWYKCPNGHIYAIGECGGAVEVGQCNDCGEAVGGTSHSLLLNIMISTDGWRYPSCVTTVNIQPF
jgi:hypothetical protein